MNSQHSVNPLPTHLKTLSGTVVSRLGFASQYLEEIASVETAFNAGINYFFSYNLTRDRLVEGLKPLLAKERAAIFITTGSEARQPESLQQYFDQVRRLLNTDLIDAFFLEYLYPQDTPEEIEALYAQLQAWKAQGQLRYIGASTHNQDMALQLIEQGQWDVLMLRYNMAHRKAEAQVLPAAQARNLPVVAFTCTRWGTLLKGHPQWQNPAPTAADCYRYALYHPAVQVALSAPATHSQLKENLEVLDNTELAIAQIQHWQSYGDLVYDKGQDKFETQWI